MTYAIPKRAPLLNAAGCLTGYQYPFIEDGRDHDVDEEWVENWGNSHVTSRPN